MFFRCKSTRHIGCAKRVLGCFACEKTLGTSDVPTVFPRSKHHKNSVLSAGTSDVPSGFTAVQQHNYTQPWEYTYLFEVPIARVRGSTGTTAPHAEMPTACGRGLTATQ